jgi:hypothetical protein
MTLDEFDQICLFLLNSGRYKLSLLGGEPTSHPQLPLFLEHALNLGLSVSIVTNGEIPAQYLAHLSGYNRSQIALLVNLSKNLRGHVHLSPFQKATLEQAGHLISLSFTIGEEMPVVSSWIDLVDTYGLHPHIRIGIAHPSPHMANLSLAPRDRVSVGETLVEIANQLHKERIGLGLDCGLTPCMFADETWQELQRLSVHSAFACGPIPDVGPGLEAWHCYPLYDLGRRKITNFATLIQLNTWLANLTEPYRLVGIREECLPCPHQLSGVCSGGCLGSVISSFEAQESSRV